MLKELINSINEYNLKINGKKVVIKSYTTLAGYTRHGYSITRN